MTTTAVPKLALPTVHQKPSKRWIDQKFLNIGPGKSGKSQFWAEGEQTLFLETEKGLGHLRRMAMPVRSWQEAREVYALLIDSAPFPYDTLVVDTIDRLVALAHEQSVLRAKEKFKTMADRINTIGDIPEGQGWYWSASMVDTFLAKLEALPAATVLIGHVTSKEISEPTRKYHRETISIGGQMGTKMLHWADHTLHVQSRYVGEKLERVLRTLPSQSMEAGSRGRVVPDGMVWGPEAKGNYALFRALFD